MRKLRILLVFSLVAALLGCFLPTPPALACSPPPCRWSGSIRVGSSWAPAGTIISAWINGIEFAESITWLPGELDMGVYDGLPSEQDGEYMIVVPSDDPLTPGLEGGRSGWDDVWFKIKRPGDTDWLLARTGSPNGAGLFYSGQWYQDVLLTVELPPVPPFATLDGQVDLQGRPIPPDPTWVTPLTVTLLQGGVAVETTDITTDNEGGFTISDIVPGTYDIRVKGSHALSRLAPGQVFTAGSTTPVNFGVLLEGDADDNNVIADPDFFMLVLAYNSVPGDPNWDERCDFNADGAVNASDFFLLTSNFGQSGG